MMLSQVGQSIAGESGRLILGRSAGTPSFISSQPSSLPMKTRRASLCSRTWRIVPAASVGYSGTDTYPAIQMAKSAMSQCAVFLAMSPMRDPGSKPSDLRYAAMRRDWSISSRHV